MDRGRRATPIRRQEEEDLVLPAGSGSDRRAATHFPSLPERQSLRVILGRAEHASFEVGLPVLAGDSADRVFAGGRPIGLDGEFSLFSTGEWMLGIAAGRAGEALEGTTRGLYQALLRSARKMTVARIWNFVPGINDDRGDGLENYRAFCAGRAAAFESAWGTGFMRRVPAASAVGSEGSQLWVLFAATARRAIHVESPLQVPAYEYPRQYGIRAPSFARATVVRGEGSTNDVFIAGTSAIRGHATASPGDTRGQLSCTLENLSVIGGACGIGRDLARGRAARRSFKVFLRHGSDLGHAAAALRRYWLDPHDRVTFLRSDICRSDLNVEIEASIFGAPSLARPG